MFMITTVLLLLHTMNCSGFLGSKEMVWMVKSPPAVPPRDLYVETHSLDFILHTLTVPSQEALRMLWLSVVKMDSLTKDEWPRNSFSVLPDFKPWILFYKMKMWWNCWSCRSIHCGWILNNSLGFSNLTVMSNEVVNSWLLSLENCMLVTPLLWAFSNLRRHWPVWIFQILILPSWEPVANISESRLKVRHKTASSIIIKLSCNS